MTAARTDRMSSLEPCTRGSTVSRAPRSNPSCASSAARRQNAFGAHATDLRLVCYSYFGTYATLPAHEGDERD